MAFSIMIVDDDAHIRTSLGGLLGDAGYTITVTADGETALKQLALQSVDMILLDVNLPGQDGISVLQQVKKSQPDIVVIMISGEADIRTAVKATQLGAYDFLEKPLSPDKVLLEIQHVEHSRKLEKQMHDLQQLVDVDYEMIGHSPAMQQLRLDIRKAAPTESRILILGENGTGKELAAREIHRLSQRAGKPFIKINCAAIPKELIESELFGYERGAFTGAVKQKKGLIEEADGGTLFLDEIGDMSLETQARLLRVLQENEFQRVGGTKVIPFDIRIISATNKNLQHEIEKGTFREDLLFRINVIPIEVPPLRNRKDDIPILTRHFLKGYSIRNHKRQKQFDDGAFEFLQRYSWPGNIRELKNMVERLVIMTDGDMITMKDVERVLPTQLKNTYVSEAVSLGVPANGSLKERLEAFERQLLSDEYKRAAGNVSKMAAALRTDRPNLHRKLKKYNIK